MNPQRRNIEVFSLSFLDCICCAFGALILLFVLSRFGEPIVLEQMRASLQTELTDLDRVLAEGRQETAALNRELASVQAALAAAEAESANLKNTLSDVAGRFTDAQRNEAVQNIIVERLARAKQELTEEMQRLLARAEAEPQRRVGGIPADSEYIIFIIDTSGSMQRFAWPLVQRKMQETLSVYPTVKGIQVMNDMGVFMFPEYEGRWIPDTPARRRAILRRLATWRSFSNSSPVEGITRAIRQYGGQDHKISLYIFGDEFSGGRMQPVVDAVDRLNRRAGGGSRQVRIHAVGFPVVMEKTRQRGNTGERFATLMRVLCHRNGGTFVGLNATRP